MPDPHTTVSRVGLQSVGTRGRGAPGGRSDDDEDIHSNESNKETRTRTPNQL